MSERRHCDTLNEEREERSGTCCVVSVCVRGVACRGEFGRNSLYVFTQNEGERV